jgi:hypothetical protein
MMTVNTTTSKITYQADGSTTAWTFPFPAITASSLQVFITDSTGNIVQLNPSQYTVVLNPPIAPNPTSAGGSVTFPISGPPLAIGNQLTINRVLTATQSTSLSNQSTIYPPVVEKEFDYLTLLDQQENEFLDRAFTVPISDPIPAPVPTVAARANQGAFFDANGNLTAGLPPAGGAIISAAMQPVVSAATLDQARRAMGVTMVTLQVTSTYVVTEGNDRQVINLTGAAFYTVTVGTPSGFSNAFWVVLVNNDTRGKLISVSGKTAFVLWPSQWVWIFQDGTGAAWMVTNPGRWQSAAPVNFYVHPTSGSDSNDGLVAGTGAFQTIQHAVNIVQNNFDGSCTIHLADGTYNVGSGVFALQGVIGADGFNIVGNVTTPLNCVIRASNNGWGFLAQDASVMSVQGVAITVDVAGNSCNGFGAFRGATMTISNFMITTMGASGRAIYCQNNGSVYVNGPFSINNSQAFSFVAAAVAGFVQFAPGTVTIIGGATCSVFMECYYSAMINMSPTTFVNGSLVTGPQYTVSGNAVLVTSGSTIPGNTPGTVSLNGIVI